MSASPTTRSSCRNEAVPKNFSGLLHPALKGKMGISIGQTSDKVIGAMIKTRGEEFVKSLKFQNIKLYSIGAPALVHTIESGEIDCLARHLSNPHTACGFQGSARWIGYQWI